MEFDIPLHIRFGCLFVYAHISNEINRRIRRQIFNFWHLRNAIRLSDEFAKNVSRELIFWLGDIIINPVHVEIVHIQKSF